MIEECERPCYVEMKGTRLVINSIAPRKTTKIINNIVDNRTPEGLPHNSEDLSLRDTAIGSETPGFALDEMLSDKRNDRSILRGPAAIAGGIAAFVIIGAFLYFSDDNSARWEIRCSHGEAEARRGLYFPWGTRQIADEAHEPLELPEGMSCASATLESLRELDTTFGGLLLEAAEARLQHGGPDALAKSRHNVERAVRLQGLSETQRNRAEALLADMAYHEARELLRQVERDLLQARRKLERARSLGAGARFGDLEDWLRFVQTATERFSPASEREENTSPSHGEDGQDVRESSPTNSSGTRPNPPQGDIFL